MKEIAKTYNHQEFEANIYDQWEKAGYFKPEINPQGEPFCVIMPPPNANGSLHLGHAVFVTIEDIMTRYARLCGKAALWLPGADHAGFETQVVFEKKLEKEGRNRFEIPRDQLYKETFEFTQKNKQVMEDQLKRLGASCDWSRGKFTLDPDIIKTVYQTFKKLHDDGLAYRDVRPVNWCTKHQTSLSDLELKHEELSDPLYYIKYGEIIVATVRPETMFGDVAIAVNPKDKRYSHMIGKNVPLPLTDREIPVIADEMVDIKFGTGAVKITPAHDPNDFEVAKRQNLEIIQVIDQFGRMNDIAGEYKGMKIKEAREKVVADLQNGGLIEKIDANYIHTVAKCYKCNTVIEPRVLPQWFIAVNKKGAKSGKTLAKDAIEAVKKGDTKFVTPKFEKIYKHWMNNIRDWNVSRQIVWGIQLPVWYCDCGESIVTDGGVPTECPKCNSKKLTQDSDVFDTWFSSGQWPFATLQTSKVAQDFDKFYPTTVMETGWDILFFWVARMIMLGLYVNDKVPFENVYLHGLVRDKDRQKMSKSKGNVIDPLGVSDLYGPDAVRMALVFGTTAGNDVVISEEKIKGMRNFSNKIWNASRFVLLRVTDGDLQTGAVGDIKISDLNFDENKFTAADKAIWKKHQSVIKNVEKNIKAYNFSHAGEELYHYFWHDFCDTYIEASKPQIEDAKTRENTSKLLIKILSESIVMLHPFMPFVTEAVWQELRKIYTDLGPSVMVAKWPPIK
jgi:valyl-tRNA synthetase